MVKGKRNILIINVDVIKYMSFVFFCIKYYKIMKIEVIIYIYILLFLGFL